MIEIGLTFLFILFLLLLFLLFSLFFYLTVKKHLKNQMRQRIDDYKEDDRLTVFTYLQSGEAGLIDSNLGEERVSALIELLSDYSHVIAGREVEERIYQFAKEHLTFFIKKELQQKRWSLRMNALFSIEDFYMVHFIPTLHELYQKKGTSLAEKSQILKLLAKFNDAKIADYLKEQNLNLSEFSLVSILSTMEEDKLDDLLSGFDRLPKKMQYILVDMIGKKQMIQHHTLLEKLVRQNEEELRIRSLKAYANSGIPIDAKRMGAFFQAENWRLRMMAAKVAGMQRLELYRETLIQLLSDSEYVVRVEAAKAILRFKEGEAILQKVIEESKDPFAKDMAVEWLEKERGGYSY